tara:strand:+ start:252 stop:1091 length:840 start_codon:yes stop_codon:yes gene_type:complete
MGACKSKLDKKKSNSLALNEAKIKDIQTKIATRLSSNKNTSNMSVKTGNSIIIRQVPSNEMYSPFFNSVTSEKKGPFGILGQKKDCALFHCPYTTKQSTTLALYTYNATINEETENIVNDIETKLRQEAKTQLSKSQANAANRALDEVRNDLTETIQSELQKLSNITVEDQQTVSIEYTTPLRCRDPCGLNGGPFGPTVKQGSMFTFHAENIVNKSLNKVTEKLAEHDVRVKQTISDENDACIIQLVICAVCCFACLFFVWKIIKMGEQKMDQFGPPMR